MTKRKFAVQNLKVTIYKKDLKIEVKGKNSSLEKDQILKIIFTG